VPFSEEEEEGPAVVEQASPLDLARKAKIQ
jgi:hypothetical protein